MDDAIPLAYPSLMPWLIDDIPHELLDEFNASSIEICCRGKLKLKFNFLLKNIDITAKCINK